MERRGWRPAVTSILVAELAGQLGHLLTGNIGAKYATMAAPPLSPPGWLFAPVWILLYALMGYGAYRIWASDSDERAGALGLYGLQLLVNCLWPVVFFRLGALWPAVALIVVLAVLVYLTMKKFSAIDELAGKVIVPYLIWVIFATYLNIGFAVLN